MGHEERFLTSRLSAGCGFGKETFAGGATMRRKRRFRTFGRAVANGLSRPQSRPFRRTEQGVSEVPERMVQEFRRR
jgi:hypothetical protein